MIEWFTVHFPTSLYCLLLLIPTDSLEVTLPLLCLCRISVPSVSFIWGFSACCVKSRDLELCHLFVQGSNCCTFRYHWDIPLLFALPFMTQLEICWCLGLKNFANTGLSLFAVNLVFLSATWTALSFWLPHVRETSATLNRFPSWYPVTFVRSIPVSV